MMSYIILIIMSLIGSVASLFLKKASSNKNFLKIVKNMNTYVGGVLYLISAVLNIIILKSLDYSVVLPLTSITYVWTLFFSSWILNERITIKKL